VLGQLRNRVNNLEGLHITLSPRKDPGLSIISVELDVSLNNSCQPDSKSTGVHKEVGITVMNFALVLRSYSGVPNKRGILGTHPDKRCESRIVIAAITVITTVFEGQKSRFRRSRNSISG
jgi:hypothetical protein